MDAVHAVSGFAVGFIVGVTGVGGGALMTPLLVLLFGVAPATAVATDLLYAAVTKSGGLWVHARRGGVDWALVGRMAAGSVPASLLTLLCLRLVPFDTEHLSALITTTLGFALMLTAIVLLFKTLPGRLASRLRKGGVPPPGAIVLAGAMLGVLVTLSSVGAGALGMAALTALAPGLSAVRIVGTDIAHAVPLTLTAGLGHALTGAVDWKLLGGLLVGSLPGIALGSLVSHRLPEWLLRRLLAVLLMLIGGKLAW